MGQSNGKDDTNTNYGPRCNIETFKDIGAGVKRIVAVGGGTKSDTWLQIVSDVTGVAQVVPELTVGASFGDAFLAGLAAGVLKQDDLKDWVRVSHIIDPDKDQ